jgi:hypothetical protein
MDKYLGRLQEKLTAACAGMNTEELSHHSPGKWSAANILEHLYLTYTGTIKGFERCLEAGKPLARKPTLRDRVAVAYVLWLNHLPEGRKAPANTTPRGIEPEKVMQEIDQKIQAMGDLIDQCEAKFGDGIKLLDHPILGPLTASEWRKFHFLHGRHHARQIARLNAECHAHKKLEPTPAA